MHSQHFMQKPPPQRTWATQGGTAPPTPRRVRDASPGLAQALATQLSGVPPPRCLFHPSNTLAEHGPSGEGGGEAGETAAAPRRQAQQERQPASGADASQLDAPAVARARQARAPVGRAPWETREPPAVAAFGPDLAPP